MPYSVELALVESDASAIDSLCDRLEEDRDITTYRRLDSAPHISLAVYDNIDVNRCADALRAFARTLSPTSVHLGAMGAFCHDRNVLFVAPAVTSELLELHERFHRTFEAFDGACWNYYRPGNWVPHVTLAIDLSAVQLGTAIQNLAPLWRGRNAALDRLRFISHPPFRVLCEFALGGETNK